MQKLCKSTDSAGRLMALKERLIQNREKSRLTLLQARLKLEEKGE